MSSHRFYSLPFPAWYEFGWGVIKSLIVIVGMTIFHFFGIDIRFYIILVGSIYFLLLYSHYMFDHHCPSLKVIYLLVLSIFIFITDFFIMATGMSNEITYTVLFLSLILSMRYFRMYLWTRNVISSFWSAILATVVRYPVIAAAILFLSNYYYGYEIESILWILGLFTPIFVPAVYLLWTKLRQRIKPYRLENNNISPIWSNYGDIPQRVKYGLYSKIRVLIYVLQAWISAITTKVQDNETVARIFSKEPPDNLQSFKIRYLFIYPSALAIIGGIFTGLWSGIGPGTPPQEIHAGIIAIAVGAVYSHIVKAFLSVHTEPSAILIKYIIPVYMLFVSVLFYPDIRLSQISLFPLGLLIFTYVTYKSGIFYGLMIVAIGIYLSLTSVTVLVLGEYLHVEGYIGDIMALFIVTIGILFVFLGHFIAVVSIYMIVEGRSKSFFYLVIGGLLLLFRNAMYATGSFAYFVGFTYQLAFYYSLLFWPLGPIGSLLILYALYNIIKGIEYKVIAENQLLPLIVIKDIKSIFKKDNV